MTDKKNLLLLFDRPGEPVFTPKGKNHAVFDVPIHLLKERYQPVFTEIQAKFADEAGVRIPVQDIAELPDLTNAMIPNRRDNFSVFIPSHQNSANFLMDIFMKAKNISELQSLAIYVRDRVNAQLFHYALSVALLHRPDTKDLNLPPFIESFPSLFLDARVFARAREEASVIPMGSKTPIIIQVPDTSTNPEQRLWYFREDLGISLHHWHWHIVYSSSASNVSIVRKDRRGELFYYMHQQIIARYNFERFCNNLPRVVNLNNLRATVPEGYAPNLVNLVSSRTWPARPENLPLRDINRQVDRLRFNISSLERWRDQMRNAITRGSVPTSGGRQQRLDEATGIDVLGNIIESSQLSVSPTLGSFHNFGHLVISYQHDPDGALGQSFNAMGAVTLAMRDPIFYRWHGLIDDILNEHKMRLTPYSTNSLTFSGIRVQSVQVEAMNGKVNSFNTFWQQSDVNLTRGMDFTPREDVWARFTHLNHVPFTINISVNNETSTSRMGMCRVFMAPKNDERGNQLDFNNQRRLMIEMDKFVVTLNPGTNNIKRRSAESTVRIPFDRTFRNLDERQSDNTQFNFCGCGWPEHMLVPRGTLQGISADFFVMISDFTQDGVNQDLTGSCNDAASYCGIRDKMFPDRKAMGYPFDRQARQGVTNLTQFLTPNMGTAGVIIQFYDITANVTTNQQQLKILFEAFEESTRSVKEEAETLKEEKEEQKEEVEAQKEKA